MSRNFVPISLLVTLEGVAFVNSFVVNLDPKLFSEYSKTSVSVQTSNLLDELGQIDYVFSDKTGTLTRNQMVFKKLIVGGRSYGDQYKESFDISKWNKVGSVDFKDPGFFDALEASKGPGDPIIEFLRFLSLCHGIQVEKKDNGTTEYSAASPDELALVNFAKFLNYEYIDTDAENNLVVRINGEETRTKLLYSLEFNSDRKRMSVITEEEGRFFIYTKGADNIVGKRLNDNNK